MEHLNLAVSVGLVLYGEWVNLVMVSVYGGPSSVRGVPLAACGGLSDHSRPELSGVVFQARVPDPGGAAVPGGPLHAVLQREGQARCVDPRMTPG